VWYAPAGVVAEYINAGQEIIVFEYGIADDSAVMINYEHAIQHTASVNGREAFFYESVSEDFANSLVWQQQGYAFALFVQNQQTGIDEIVKIAESISFS
jgi:hypothetical protein